MASSPLSLSLLLLLVISISNVDGDIQKKKISISNAIPTPSQIGGFTDIPNVATNKEVQDLGRFSVEEHNKSIQNAAALSFVRVLAAKRQLVAGTNYLLTLAATDGQGKEATFDALVFEPLGPSPAKKLISFKPSKPGQ